MQTPRELRHFQDHCWCIYQATNKLILSYNHSVQEICRVTTSALHFTNLLWRTKVIHGPDCITEYYCWIRRQVRRDLPDRPTLEPTYNVAYPWDMYEWIVTRLEHPNI